MKGWHIFTHSVRLVLNNLGAAMRVSLVLYLVQVANQMVLFLNPPPINSDGMTMITPGALGLTLLLSILAIVASLWIAVAWHRYVLAEEHPAGWLPQWHGPQLLGYLGRSLMIGLLLAAALLVASIPVGLAMSVAPALAGLLLLGLIGLAGYLFFRLGVMLPAAAMGRAMKLREAWDATKDGDGAVVILALLVIAASVIVQAPSWLNANPASLINLIYGLVTGWFATIIGISVLTTLYGHYVEGRAID